MACMFSFFQSSSGISAEKALELSLFKAIKHDNATAVRKILIEDKSVHPDCVYEIKDTYGLKWKWTPLTYAIETDAAQSFDVILAIGADVNLSAERGKPLLMAAWENRPHYIDKLLAAGADVNMQDGYGSTALMLAARNNATACLDKLLAAGADVNMQDGDGETALMLAAEKKRAECTKLLLSAGANVRIKNYKGETAEGIAMKKNHTAIVQLLKDHQHQQRQPPNQQPPPQPSTSTSQSRPSAPPLSFPDAPPPPPPNRQQQQRYHSQELEISFSELSIGDDLGRGSFGVVKLAELHQIQVAVKIFSTSTHDDPLTTEVLQEMQREAKLLGNLRHPNVVSMMGICTTPPCIIMEYCSKGSLFEVIASARSQSNNMHNRLTWKRRVGLVRDIALGMTFLHSRQEPVIHRDLKSPNILIDESWKAKVADLNLSRAIKEVDESGHMAAMSTAVRPTNYRWLAPELLDRDTRASAASDVYALGIMMWELLTWQIPFGQSIEPAAMVACLLRGKKLDIPAMNELPGPEPPSAFPGINRYIQLMKQCLSQDPKKRPTMAEVASTLRELWTALPSTTDGNVAAGGGGGAAGGAAVSQQSTLPVLADATKGKGLAIRGRVERTPAGSIVYKLSLENISTNASLSGFMIQINKNALGLAPTNQNIQITTLVPGAVSGEIAVPLVHDATKVSAPPANDLLQVAIKCSPLGVVYLTDNIPLECSLVEDGSIEGSDFIAGGAPSNEAAECVVCLDQKAVIALIHHSSNQGNTAHMCCCAECAESLQSRRQPCPMCRQPIDDIVKVY